MTGRSMIPAPTGRDGGERGREREREKWWKEKDEDKNLQLVGEQGEMEQCGAAFQKKPDASQFKGETIISKSQPAELIGFHF